jgi:predicted MPP superfamily phosphohydrolase
MTLRIAQISDAHLSARRPFFQHNWEVLLEHLAQAAPDLIVSTGDMTIDGSDHESELDFAADQFRRLGREVLFVPGNHDIGNSRPDVRGGETLITEERRTAYCRRFGHDFWVRDLDGWRLVGLNSMLPGSGLAAEGEQDALLQHAITTLGRRKLIVLAHKPLYIADPQDTQATQSALFPEHRARWQTLLEPAGSMLMLSGHIHAVKTARWGSIRQIWAPSTAFVMDAAGRKKKRHGVQRPGYLLHSLNGRRHTYEFVEPYGFLITDLGNWFHNPAGFHARYAVESLRGLALNDKASQ